MSDNIAIILDDIFNWALQDITHLIGYLVLMLILALIVFEIGSIIIKVNDDKYGNNMHSITDKKARDNIQVSYNFAHFLHIISILLLIAQFIHFFYLTDRFFNK